MSDRAAPDISLQVLGFVSSYLSLTLVEVLNLHRQVIEQSGGALLQPCIT